MSHAPSSGHGPGPGRGPHTWHVDDSSLRRWVDGLAGPLVSASVEQHVLRCADCRAAVATLVPPTTLAPTWDAVLTTVEVPRRGLVERWLGRLGLGTSDAKVLTAASTLRVAWLTGTIFVLAFTVIAALLSQDGGIALFLIAAPLIPVAGVAAAYGPSVDPSYEAVLSTPYSMLRLVLLRTAAVLVASAPLVGLSGLLLPTSAVISVAWLLPALGFVALVLTAGNWVEPSHAAVTISAAWVVAVLIAGRAGDPLTVFAPAALLVYTAVAAVAGTTFVLRLQSNAPSWRLR